MKTKEFGDPPGGLLRPPKKISLVASAAPEFLQAILGNHLRDTFVHYHQKLAGFKSVR